ncbi:MAG: hypothetical protein RBT65_16800 [Methanolobus sp.]|nr:hypothetical protein [Methanolobus sp.]
MENAFVQKMEKLKESLMAVQPTVETPAEGTTEKSYVAPSANNTILNQKFGKLLIDEGNAFADLIVDNSQLLKMVNVDKVRAMKSTINVYEANAKLVQVESGVDPFATVGNLASYYNLGYDVVLQSVQLVARIDKETLMAMETEPDWSTRVSNQIAKVHGNELFKLAMFATPASGADVDVLNGYNDGKLAPYTGSFSGWMQTLKKGYTTTKDGSSATCTVGGYVDTYDSDASKYKTINTVLEELVATYPEDYNNPSEVKIMMSMADFFKYKISVAKADSTTEKYESGKIYDFFGYEIVPVPYLKAIDKEVTVSAAPYYPGMVIMGRPKDLVLKMNISEISENSEYYPKLRTYDTIYDTPLAMGVIVQRFAVAYRSRES